MDLKKFLYLFFTRNDKLMNINSNTLLTSHNFLKNKSIDQIKLLQKKATENVFNKKKIPFRSFEINKLDEKTLGELFIFFILETILLGKVLKLNPFNQPAVELIKKETNRLFNQK